MIVDPNLDEREQLVRLLGRQYAAASFADFEDPLLAVKYGANNVVDALYTVTGMKRLNGFELARMLRSFSPAVRLHFIADTEQEKTDAMRLMAEGCVLRPVTADKLKLTESAEW